MGYRFLSYPYCLSLPFPNFLSLSRPLFLCLFLFQSLTLCLSLSLFQSLSLSLSVSISISLFLSLSLPLPLPASSPSLLILYLPFGALVTSSFQTLPCVIPKPGSDTPKACVWRTSLTSPGASVQDVLGMRCPDVYAFDMCASCPAPVPAHLGLSNSPLIVLSQHPAPFCAMHPHLVPFRNKNFILSLKSLVIHQLKFWEVLDEEMLKKYSKVLCSLNFTFWTLEWSREAFLETLGFINRIVLQS